MVSKQEPLRFCNESDGWDGLFGQTVLTLTAEIICCVCVCGGGGWGGGVGVVPCGRLTGGWRYVEISVSRQTAQNVLRNCIVLCGEEKPRG